MGDTPRRYRREGGEFGVGGGLPTEGDHRQAGGQGRGQALRPGAAAAEQPDHDEVGAGAQRRHLRRVQPAGVGHPPGRPAVAGGEQVRIRGGEHDKHSRDPTIVGMELIEQYRRSVAGFTERLSQVRPDQWAAPTPCTGWDVRALVNHIVYEERWMPPLCGGATIAEVGDRFEGDLLGSNPVVSAAEAAREAEAAVRLDQTVHLSFGDLPGSEYLRQLIADHLIHAWDLAAAIGAGRTLDPEVVRECARWYAEHEDSYRSSGVVAARVSVPASASEQDRLLGAFGRDPEWTPWRLVAPAVVLDFSDRVGADPDFLLSIDDVTAWQDEHGPLPSGGWLLYRTGWDVRGDDADAFANGGRSPGIAVECARWLAESTPIIGVGVETVGTDAGAAHSFDPPFPCHSYLLGAGKYRPTQLRNVGPLPFPGRVVRGAP